jgi:hypothetical protein
MRLAGRVGRRAGAENKASYSVDMLELVFPTVQSPDALVQVRRGRRWMKGLAVEMDD